MREITIGNQTFEIRGLRLSEVSLSKMRKLGFGRFLFNPAIEIGSADQQERMGEIMDTALQLVLGKDGVERVDQAGGVSGLHAAFRAIIAETYGTPGEEKNSSPAGSGPATPSGPPTAAAAAEASAAGSASTASRPS
jgi:hypothetical protein